MSISVLEKFISGADKKTCMPAVSCLGSVSDNGCSVGHNWENAIDVDPTEMSCQVVLVSMYFVFCTMFKAIHLLLLQITFVVLPWCQRFWYE